VTIATFLVCQKKNKTLAGKKIYRKIRGLKERDSINYFISGLGKFDIHCSIVSRRI
jgi:hypothetical protein